MEIIAQAKQYYNSFLVPRQNPAFGGFETKDSLVVDGLFDVYNKVPMGNCAEHTAAKLKITREDQDDFCLSSYTRAQEAWAADAFADEIAPVTVKGRKGDVVVKEDEDYKKLLKDKFRTIRPVFVKENGTVTAANASTLNDGASAVVLASGEVVEKEGLKPLAKILGMSPSPWFFFFFGMFNTKSNPLDRLRRRRLCPHRLPHRPYPRRAPCPQERRCVKGRDRPLGIQRGLFRGGCRGRKGARSGQVQGQRQGRCRRSRPRMSSSSSFLLAVVTELT